MLRADDLWGRYQQVRNATETLAAPLSAEDQQLQSMPDCSPTKWHRAHTTWFFEEFVLTPRGVTPVHPSYGYLFNSYYEAVGPRHERPRRGMLSRPSADEIAAYRRTVDGRMGELLSGADEATRRELAPILALGLAHEEQHQELLLTDILHAFSGHPLRPAYRGAPPSVASDGGARARGDTSSTRWLEHGGGLVEVGFAGEGFAFDNEGPRHRVWLEPFALADRPITVGEVRAFMADGGYATPSLWLSEGMAWVRREQIEAPGYWQREGDAWRVFGLDGLRTLDDDEPAGHLSYYEADAIARYLGGRLPTEAEWEVLASSGDPSVGNFRDDGALCPRPPARRGGLFGDVWQWTSSAYAAYPRFAAAPGAVGEYNGKFMVNQMVLRGGSCLTPRGHVRATYRNFWPAPTRFQMTGARVARDV